MLHNTEWQWNILSYCISPCTLMCAWAFEFYLRFSNPNSHCCHFLHTYRLVPLKLTHSEVDADCTLCHWPFAAMPAGMFFSSWFITLSSPSHKPALTLWVTILKHSFMCDVLHSSFISSFLAPQHPTASYDSWWAIIHTHIFMAVPDYLQICRYFWPKLVQEIPVWRCKKIPGD